MSVEAIKELEEYREAVNAQINEAVAQVKEDAVIAEIIHRAIMKATNLAYSNNGNYYNIMDIVPDKRHNVVYVLAKQLKEVSAELIRKRHVIEDVNESLIKTRDIIIKEWQKISEE